jgi:hypothetical protein
MFICTPHPTTDLTTLEIGFFWKTSPALSWHLVLVAAQSLSVFLRFPLHRWCCRILALYPVPRAAADIRQAEPLRHDALEAELAGVAENDVATLGDVFIQLHGPGGFADQLGKCPLALLDRCAAQVFAA